MKSLIVIILFFCLVGAYGQKNDTIKCGNISFVLPLPSVSLRHSTLFEYEEGFYKTFPVDSQSYIVFQYGGMISLPIFANNKDCTIEQIFQFGNIITSYRGRFNKTLFFREDSYRIFKVSIYYVAKDQIIADELDLYLNSVEVLFP